MGKNNYDKIDLSVVVLGYQAGKELKLFINELIRFLEEKKINYQIVLVANYWPGFSDITPQVVRDLVKDNYRIKPVIKEKQGQMGWDMRSGLLVADGDFIAVIDGDGQMPAYDIIRVYQKIKQGNFDLVKTYRQQRLDDFWRRIISFLYNLFFKILFPGLNATDINSKPKIFTRQLYNKLKLTSNDWFIDAEIMIQVRRLKVKIGEIPTVFKENERRSSFVKFSAIFEFIKNLIKARIYESFNNWRHW